MERMSSYDFHRNQVGFITETVEPISDRITLRDALAYFMEDEDLEAVPVELSSGYGILTKDDLIRKKGQLGAMGRTVSSLEELDADDNSVSSHENVNRVLRDVVKNNRKDYFLVFKERNLLGVVSLRNLVRHVTDLQEEEVNRGRALQEFLMSENLVEDKRFKLVPTIQRAHDLGGDYFYSTALSDSLSMICCFEAASDSRIGTLLSVMIDSYFKTRKMTGSIEADKPENLMLSLNGYLFKHTPEEVAVRCIFLFIDSAAGSLSIYNFDYTTPFLILLEEGKVKAKMPSANFKALGTEDLVIFREKPKVASLESLSHIFLYSEGLAKCVNPNGQAFGVDRIKDCLMDNFKSLGSGFSTILEEQVNEFRREMPLLEDISTMVVSFN